MKRSWVRSGIIAVMAFTATHAVVEAIRVLGWGKVDSISAVAPLGLSTGATLFCIGLLRVTR